MRIDVLGCRGSVPVDGAAFDRYGGATSSVALSHGEEDPVLVLDAGTGLRHLGRITDRPFRGTLLLSHLHWDHIQGLPFSPLLDHPAARVDAFAPSQGPRCEDLIARFMSPPVFPISPVGLVGDWRFHDAEPGTFEVEGFSVTAFEVPHKGGRTFGFRVDDGTTAMAYVSDHAPGAPGTGPAGLGDIRPEVVEAVDGVDFLFHDAQYLDDEFPSRARLGHSAVGYALDLGRKAGVGTLVLFHHDPSRTDTDLDAIAASLPTGVTVARQGMRI